MDLNDTDSSDSEQEDARTSKRQRTVSRAFSAREGGEANPVTSPCSSRPPLTEEQQPRMANGKRRADASGELGSELDGPSWEQGAGKRPRTSPKYFEAGAALPPSAAHAERRAQVADEEAVDVGFVFLSKPFCELQLARFREWLMGPHPD